MMYTASKKVNFIDTCTNDTIFSDKDGMANDTSGFGYHVDWERK